MRSEKAKLEVTLPSLPVLFVLIRYLGTYSPISDRSILRASGRIDHFDRSYQII